MELQGKDYDKAEKCLAQAIYFEARNEPARGQQAVAQVVLNRVFSPYYPKDVCSVVYQNAHRHLSCQFTFACDGKPEAVNEHGAWARANRIATQTLERQGLAAGGRQGDALSRRLRPAELDPRHEGHGPLRPAHVLSSAQLGRRLERGALGHAGEYGEVRDRHGEAGRTAAPANKKVALRKT